jgi:hypothetical protein
MRVRNLHSWFLLRRIVESAYLPIAFQVYPLRQLCMPERNVGRRLQVFGKERRHVRQVLLVIDGVTGLEAIS